MNRRHDVLGAATLLAAVSAPGVDGAQFTGSRRGDWGR